MRALTGVDVVQTNYTAIAVGRVKLGLNRQRESCLGRSQCYYGGFEVETSVGKRFKVAVVTRHSGPFAKVGNCQTYHNYYERPGQPGHTLARRGPGMHFARTITSRNNSHSAARVPQSPQRNSHP